jgi:F420-dependent oxidoreductase-like protein
MKLGLVFGYWGAGPRDDYIPLAREAEQLGFDSVWVAESWGNDAFTFAAWVAAHTSTIKIGTGVVQIAARTPTATAMAAATLDHLSGGRVILGLGVSGPQVVEGWYGRPSNRPLARTREYVDVIRRALRRDGPLTNDGEFYPLPYRGEDASGLGKPLKIMVHPLRTEIPIYLGAEGPKNVAQTAEIADGWLPLYYSPYRPEVYADQLAAAKPGFEVAALVNLAITDDVAAGLWPVKATLGFYIGGMGAKGQNYHTKLMARMGFEAESEKIQDLFFAGKRDEAIAAVPEDFADEIALVGPPSRIAKRLEAWRESAVTTLLVSGRDAEQLRQIRDLVLG